MRLEAVSAIRYRIPRSPPDGAEPRDNVARTAAGLIGPKLICALARNSLLVWLTFEVTGRRRPEGTCKLRLQAVRLTERLDIPGSYPTTKQERLIEANGLRELRLAKQSNQLALRDKGYVLLDVGTVFSQFLGRYTVSGI